MNLRLGTQKAAFHLGSGHTAMRVRSLYPGWAPLRLLLVCDGAGTERAPRSARGCGPSLGGRSPAPPLLGGLWVCCNPAVIFFPPYLREPILRDQMIPAVLVFYLKVVVFSFFFPSLTLCVCVNTCQL